MTTRRSIRFAALCIAAAMSWGIASAAQTINGVKVDDATDVQGTALQLNGAGTRYKFVVKVYVAALYTGKKVASLDELIALPGPKRLNVTMLRDVDAAELGKLLTRGMEDNSGRAEVSKMINGLIRMGQIFADQKKLVAGDTFQLDWVPGSGTIMTVKGKVQGEPFKEPEFFKALMAIWLGTSPADSRLKDALLGVKANSSSNPN